MALMSGVGDVHMGLLCYVPACLTFPKRCFGVLGSLNLLSSSLLKVQIIMTSYRNVISSLLSFLSAIMYYSEHSGGDQ